MKRKISFVLTMLLLLTVTGCGRDSGEDSDSSVHTEAPHTFAGYPVVYITSDVSPKGLLSAYQALDASVDGAIAVKLSDSPPDSGFQWPELAEGLTQALDSPKTVEEGAMASEYDSVVVLSHFRRNDQAGFSGALENLSSLDVSPDESDYSGEDSVLEVLPERCKNAVDSLENVLYINVLDRWSVDDSVSDIGDIAVVSSYDPVALDQACVDLVFMGEEYAPFAEHIRAYDGVHMLVNAEEIGLGSRTYAFSSIDG